MFLWVSYPSLIFFYALEGEQIKLLFAGENILSWKIDLVNAPALVGAFWDGQWIIGF